MRHTLAFQAHDSSGLVTKPNSHLGSSTIIANSPFISNFGPAPHLAAVGFEAI